MRSARYAVIAALGAVTVTAGCTVGSAPIPPPGSASPSTTPIPVAALPALLAQLPAGATAPTAATVTAALAGPVSSVDLGGQLAGEVVDAQSGAVYWARAASAPVAPASTLKLLTCTVALEALGPDARLVTSVRRSGAQLWLVGGGDPTLSVHPSSPTTYPPTGSLSRLAVEVAAALHGTGVTHVSLHADASAYSGPTTATGWSTSYLTEGDVVPPSALDVDDGRVAPGQLARVPHPVAAATQQFATQLRKVGLTVVVAAGQTAPTASTELASVQSAPVAQLVTETLEASDNDLAEALARAVARHDGMPASFAGAAAAELARLGRLQVPTSGLVLYDGSGLSRDDRVSADALVAVLRMAADGRHPELGAILDGLPVAGATGTLAARYRKGPASSGAGLVRAKTGTLTGLNAEAGLVPDAAGRLLVVAMIASHAPAPVRTEAALDRIFAALTAVP